MKSEMLILEDPCFAGSKESAMHGIYDLIYRVPYLPAYALINHHLDNSSQQDLDGLGQSQAYELRSDSLILWNQKILLPDHCPEIRLTIQHAGISDHSKLFLYVKERSLRKRLGQYASEAEKCFESGAWASFVAMVGAVVEGILLSLLPGSDKFAGLLNRARDKGFVTEAEYQVLDQVRNARNLIMHAGRHKSDFIGREEAMQVFAVYYRVVRKDWEKIMETSDGRNR